MCGICGITGLKSHDSQLQLMIDTMKHRGPDDEGKFIGENIALGHVRLSIIDTSSAGHQPMISKNKRFVIVFNGEIYNYLELKKQFLLDYETQTNSDTEILLAMYEKYGKDCLNYLNGMFAFAVYDRKKKSLFVVRDRFGIKPLYYYFKNNVLCFASEIDPIIKFLNDRNIHVEQNNAIIFDYLASDRTHHSHETFYKDIFKLQHGFFFTYENKKFELKKWYNLSDKIIQNQTVSSEDFYILLENAVKLRLRSDVAVGTCLSGGLDSSSIVSIVEKQNPNKKFHTFSAVYGKGLHGDESQYIDLFNNYNIEMHKVQITGESFFKDMQKFIYSQQEPVPTSSAYAEYRVMNLAKDYVTVILNGQGADELFAGYDYYYAFLLKEFLKQQDIRVFFRELKGYKATQQNYRVLINLIYLLVPPVFRSILKRHSRKYLAKDFFNNYYSSREIVDLIFKQTSLQSSLLFQFDTAFEHHLIWGDHSSMNFSLESRFPFLDHHLVEKSLALPNADKIYQGVRKVLIRKAMKDKIPEQIRQRQDKIGYATPEDKWFREEPWKSLVLEILNSEWIKNCYYFNQNKIKKMFNLYCENKINIGSTIWKIINLYFWQNKKKANL